MCTIKALRQRHALTSIHQDVDLLLAESIGKNTMFLETHPEYHLKINEYLHFRWFLFHYRRGYSAAVVIGHKEFFGLDFLVNKHTLIPRPDTELLVEEAIHQLQAVNYKLPAFLVDVGTGSGCIPISILKTSLVQPAAACAIDISKKALRVARKNAELHNAKIRFLRGNLLEPFLATYKLKPTSYQLVITANLPYLTREQAANEPSIQKEPITALVAEEDGLALYRELFAQIQALLGQMPITILCEIDPSQTTGMSLLIKKYLPTATVEIKKDLAGLDRLAIINKR